MLLLLLAYAQITNGSPITNIAVASTPSATSENDDSGRTLYNIIWSSLATIFACVWTAVHRNIPGPSQGRLSRVLDMVGVVVGTLLVPEWVLAGAVRQYLNARSLGKQLEAARADATKAWDAKRQSLLELRKPGDRDERSRTTAGSKEQSTEVLVEVKEKDGMSLKQRTSLTSRADDMEELGAEQLALLESTLAVEDGIGRLGGEWNTRHGFFIIMGGFHYYKDGKPLFPLSRHDVVELVRAGDLVPPTDDEIRGWSQGDALSKLIAIIQTLWFVIQCIARRVEGLAITQLEIMTLAYTTIVFVMYVCWWYKPLNVNGPVRVAAKRLPKAIPVEHRSQFWTHVEIVVGSHDRLVDMREQAYVPPFYTGGEAGGPPLNSNDALSGGIAVVAAMIFGAVHCAAWNYAFPTAVEMHIWRIGAAAIVAVPGAMAVASVVALGLQRTILQDVGNIFMVAVFGVSGPVYVVARILLLGLSFATLRMLPPGAYQAVQWTLKIPHFA
ncbi:hypothetical protein BV25DRAFT_1919911 [Artomyces pyxidatus]|uniref:Uncharacterized protein n=1 Tax=Artomyces pyxidatus TaxID=48021 RepID=A0ACB8SNA5_9AGAM|nr:hypothetical protein BV25DRAFT_1919911 [Artomyces pyxidatus]